ncbi:MAG: DUF748 domain-containing protein [Planctomycetes bacterium]|nr:DUF748 domain-containing protein [Planctomycetota bacterium]
MTASATIPPPPPGRRWRRRLLWTLFAVVLGRLGLALGMPLLIDRAAAAVGCRAEYRSFDLSLLGLSLCLRGFALHDRTASTAAAPLLRIDELAVDVDQWALLRGRVRVRDAVLDGLQVQLVRTADGGVALPLPQPASEAEPPVAATTTPPPSPADSARGPWAPPSFALPLQVDSLRVHNLNVQWREGAATPHTGTLDLDARDLGLSTQPGTVRLRAQAPGRLDTLQLDAELHGREQDLRAQFAVQVRGAQLDTLPLPAAARTWLAGAQVLDGRIQGQLTLAHATGEPLPLDGQATLSVQVQLDRTPALELAAGLGPVRRALDSATVPFTARLAIAEAVDQLEVTAGELRCDGARLHTTFAVQGRGLHGRRCSQALAAAGVVLPPGGTALDAEFLAGFDLGSGTLDAAVRNLRCGTPDDAVVLRELAVAGCALHQGTVAQLRLDGPTLRAQRLADGSLQIAGLRLLPSASAPEPMPASKRSTPTHPSTTQPFLLQELDWRNAACTFVDQTLPTAAQVTALVSATGRALGTGPDAEAGQLVLDLAFAGQPDRLRTELHCRGWPLAPRLELQVAGDGLTLQPIAPWLAEGGLAATWRAARLRAQVAAAWQADAAGTTLSAQLSGLEITDGDTQLLAWPNLQIEGLRTSPQQGLTLAAVHGTGPQWHWLRQADGEVFAGIALAKPNGPATAATAPAPTPERPEPAPIPTERPAPWRTGPVHLRDVRCTVADRRTGSQDTTVTADLQLGPATTGSAIPISATVRVPDGLDALTAQAELTLGPAGATAARATVEASHLRGRGLAALLPEGLEVTLADGALAARFRFDQGLQAPGLVAELRELQLRDGDQTLLALDELSVRADAVGPERIHLAQVALTGLRGQSASLASGLQLPGLRVRSGAPGPSPATAQELVTPAPGPAAAGRMAATGPALRIDRFEVVLAEWQHRGAEAAGEPQRLAGTVRLAEPFATTPDPTESAPLRIAARLAATPCLAELALDLAARPFALRPDLDLHLALRELDPDRLASVWPALHGQLGGTAGPLAVQCSASVQLDLRRTEPWRFAVDRPFGVAAHLEDLAVRDASGQTLLGLAGADLAVAAIDPATGDVRIRHLEVEALTAAVHRRSDRLELAGCWIATPSEPAPAPASPAPATTGGAERRAVLAIDHLGIADLSLDYRDSTTAPATHLPLAGLDLDVHDWSSLVLREPLPFRVQLTAQGGEAQLPRRVAASSLLAGVAGSALQALQLGRDQHTLEPRPWFGDLRAEAELQVYPWPKGRCRFDLAGLELAALRGLANQGAVAIDDGLCDASATVDLRAEQTQVEAGLVFTHLAVREPPNGPISTYLKLPAPLESVLFLLRNDADEQRIPLQFALPNRGPVLGPLGAAAGEALALVIANAVAKAPLRLASAVTGLFDFGGKSTARRSVSVPFAAGAPEPDGSALLALLPEVAGDPDQQFVLEHQLGEADRLRLATLVNPPAEGVRANLARLRQLRTERLAARQALAAAAAAQLGAAQAGAAATVRALAAADAELGAIELALDAALEQFDAATDPRAGAARTRKAAAALGKARLAAVAELLRQRLPPGSDERIAVRPARGGAAASDAPGQVLVVVRPLPPQAKAAAEPGAALSEAAAAERAVPPPARRNTPP